LKRLDSNIGLVWCKEFHGKLSPNTALNLKDSIYFIKNTILSIRNNGRVVSKALVIQLPLTDTHNRRVVQEKTNSPQFEDRLTSRRFNFITKSLRVDNGMKLSLQGFDLFSFLVNGQNLVKVIIGGALPSIGFLLFSEKNMNKFQLVKCKHQ
jgi:hypothetical protein